MSAEDTAELALARQIDQRVRGIAGRMKQDFLELGQQCLEMDQIIEKGTYKGYKRWALLKDGSGEYFHSFEQWLTVAVPKSRSLALAAKAAMKRLGESVSRHDLERMTAQNMRLLAQLPEKKRTDCIIEAAVEKDYKEFVRIVQTHAPEELQEAKRRLIFNCDISQADKIDEILEYASIELGEAGDHPLAREESLELVLVEWIQYRELVKRKALPI